MGGLTIQSLGLKITNKWILDGLGEILATFILALFVFAGGCQDVLTHGAASTPTGRALAAGVGLTIAVYATLKTSGGSANPNVTIMLCLLGKVQWRKFVLYSICEFIGAFLAAVVTYYLYQDLINAYDGGVRTISGEFATAGLFTSFPNPAISKTTGFFDVMLGTAVLTGAIAAIVDHNNAGVPKYLIPLVFTPMLFGIVAIVGVNTGCAINTALDISGRIFASLIYGTEVFSHADTWAWIPPVAGLIGGALGGVIYQLMVGNHLENNDIDISSSNNRLQEPSVTIKAYNSTTAASISSNSTELSVVEHEKSGNINGGFSAP